MIGRLPHRACRLGSARGLFMRCGQARAVPAALRDIRFDAEREPDLAGGGPAGQRLVGRASERGQHEVAREHPPVGVAELVTQRLTEFTQPHALNPLDAKLG
jgi:hypothetical protein